MLNRLWIREVGTRPGPDPAEANETAGHHHPSIRRASLGGVLHR